MSCGVCPGMCKSVRSISPISSQEGHHDTLLDKFTAYQSKLAPVSATPRLLHQSQPLPGCWQTMLFLFLHCLPLLTPPMKIVYPPLPSLRFPLFFSLSLPPFNSFPPHLPISFASPLSPSLSPSFSFFPPPRFAISSHQCTTIFFNTITLPWPTVAWTHATTLSMSLRPRFSSVYSSLFLTTSTCALKSTFHRMATCSSFNALSTKAKPKTPRRWG